VIYLQNILQQLADGKIHHFSDESLSHSLDLLNHLGLSIVSPAIGQYQWLNSFSPLDAARLYSLCSDGLQEFFASIHVMTVLDSSNRYLLEQVDEPQICLVEYQTDGRGQHGRTWLAPWGGNICLSIRYHWDTMTNAAGLTLAVAVAIANLLREWGVPVSIKWPNDLYVNQAKLAGLLLDIRHLKQKQILVLGLGLNYDLTQAPITLTQYAPADLKSVFSHLPSRTVLAAQLIETCFRVLSSFPYTGLSPYLADWAKCDALFEKNIAVQIGQQTHYGIAQGITEQGALRVRTGATIRHYSCGSVRQVV
jgi:BirA family transcriptional regulator, biotin operon repressor / biotin---[acetyl-CoA-carboxylase] ligase